MSHIFLFAVFIWLTYFLFKSPLTEIVGAFGKLNGYAVAFIMPLHIQALPGDEAAARRAQAKLVFVFWKPPAPAGGRSLL